MATSDSFWKKEQEKGAKKKKYVDVFEESFNIGFVMKKCGWAILRNILAFEKTGGSGKIGFKLKSPNGNNSPFSPQQQSLNQLENYFNMKNVLTHYYQKK